MYNNLNFAPPHEMRPTSLEELRELAETKFAFTSEAVDLSSAQVNDEGIITVLGEDFPMTKPAFRQLCTRRLKIPDPFAKFIPWELLSYNIHDIMPRMGEMNVVHREDDNAIIGFAPMNYVPVDHTAMLDKIQSHSAFEETFKMSISDESMAIDFPWGLFDEKELSIEPIKGDVIKSGMRLMHSPAGFTQTALRYMLWRLVCGNGMVMPSTIDSIKMRLKPGRDIEKGIDTFLQKAEKQGPHLGSMALPARIIELDNPMNADTFSKYWKGIKKVVDNDADFTDVQVFECTDEDRKDWMSNSKAYSRGRAEKLETTTVNGWAMVNNLTHLAKEFDQRTRHAMENFAGKILINQTAA
jgi:hypothetical protein